MEQVRFGDWVKCEDDIFVAMDNIAEIRIEYQGSEVKEDDYFEVVLIQKQHDFWLPSNPEREIANKHHNHYNQMSDPIRNTVYLGPKEKCKEVVHHIMGTTVEQTLKPRLPFFS